jgi:hypothetical protein
MFCFFNGWDSKCRYFPALLGYYLALKKNSHFFNLALLNYDHLRARTFPNDKNIAPWLKGWDSDGEVETGVPQFAHKGTV